jgi:glutamate dehydrogenase
MITADAARRATLLEAVRPLLDEGTPPEDRELLHAFAAVVFPGIPDAIAFHLTPAETAARLRAYFRFVVRAMPPEYQLYRGLPGIHVVVRNPEPEEETAGGSATGHHYDITIVETHTPDAPFIFESLKNFFQREGLRAFSAIHPMFTVRRQWERIAWIGGPAEDGQRELFCQFRIERVEAPDRLRRIEHQVFALLKSVFLAVEDHRRMQQGAEELAGRLRSRSGDPVEAEQARALLGWLFEDNFVHLGALHYTAGPDGQLHAAQDRALGVFKDPALLPVVFPGLQERLAAHLAPRPGDDRVLDVDYPTGVSAIHHLEPVDDIVVREWRPDGALEGATLILGRVSKSAFAAKAEDVPTLREKLAWMHAHSGALPNSHAHREMRAIFNYFPKRELFYADAASLQRTIEQMVHMSSDEEIVVTVRPGRAYQAVHIAFSDLRYSRRAEEALKDALAAAFGPVTFSAWGDCGTTGVLVYYFDESTLEHPLDADRVRDLARAAITTWEDRTAQALEEAFGPLEGRRLFKKYVRTETRSGLYRESTRPEEVPEDLRHLELLEARLEMTVVPASRDSAMLKLYSPKPIGLTDTIRTLQHFTLAVVDELNIALALPEGRKGWLSRLQVEGEPRVIAALHAGGPRLLDALRAVQEERTTDCPLNGLVLLEGLAWREVEVLRTVRNHLLQVRPHYNADTINAVLLRNSAVARLIFGLFAARLDPRRDATRKQDVTEAQSHLTRALKKVTSLVDDEILRALANLVQSTLRTNYFQVPERPVIAVKVDSGKVEGMVSPRPMVEIYVHAPQLQGIHLRGGKVARGGIRWSDRHDDFRTEILGLMKTQMVKNSIIVPVGSKGGFVLKGNVPPRPALDAYLIDRYRQFVSGLLDVTDNLVNGAVVHPPEVVRHDGDDPYLVVAADKGTAHLSDTANQVSAQYGFWLGDAFASGGSVGYDHKVEGITARGAWECVRHHFRNLGVDVQAQPFTMAGIGDMSGDVFGNGALRSRTTRLVAAFDHRHIFIDPAPDPVRSFAERERLFKLPRSSWRDYDAAIVSAGGGVFDRSAKAIPVSPQVRALLGIEQAEVSGEEMIRRILTAPVDLLYNGGIGTYVKASFEDDAQVGDRANDRVRVNGKDLRAKVVAEGGNLGLTQAGRIEYWRAGGLINTDAVDNSGGVDMSDHEVNLKILLDHLVRTGVVASRAARNALLREMTDEVSALVLEDNDQQALALTLDGLRTAAAYEEAVAFLDTLVSAGIVNPQDDALPSRESLLASPARERGLPRPVLAVLLGHVKNWAFRELLASTVVDHALARLFLEAYFPARLGGQYAAHFAAHPLRREIVATGVVNALVNNEGVAFLHRVTAASGAGVGAAIEAWLTAAGELDAAGLRARVRSAGWAASDEHAALLELAGAVEGAVLSRLGGQTAGRAPDLGALRARLGG